jgi:hypothetical protein
VKPSCALPARLHQPLLATAAVLLLAGCATQSQPGGGEPLTARVIRVKGTARWASDYGMPWQVVKAGTRFPPGAVVETGVDSRIDMALGRIPRLPSEVLSYQSARYANMIRLWENSRLRFDQLAQRRTKAWRRPAEEVRIELSAGHMFGVVPTLAEGSSYEIKFGPCVARVLGTAYDLSIEGLLKVPAGSVSVTWPGSSTPQVVMAGQEFDVRTGVLQAIPDLYKYWLAR